MLFVMAVNVINKLSFPCENKFRLVFLVILLKGRNYRGELARQSVIQAQES